MLLPNIVYNLLNSRDGKSFLGAPIRVSNLSGRMMVIKWKSKQWTVSKSKKSKHYSPSSEGEQAIDMLDEMKIQYYADAKFRGSKESMGFYALLFGLFTFALNSANAYAWFLTEHNFSYSSILSKAVGIGINALCIGAIYIAIIGISTSVAINEKRLDIKYVYILCRNLFWFTILLTIASFYPLRSILTV